MNNTFASPFWGGIPAFYCFDVGRIFRILLVLSVRFFAVGLAVVTVECAIDMKSSVRDGHIVIDCKPI